MLRLTLATCLIVAAGISLDAQAKPHSREIVYGHLIASQLRPDDEVLIVRREVTSASAEGIPTPRAAAEAIRRLCEGGVILVNVDVVVPKIVERGAWVETHFSGVIAEIVWPGQLSAAVGERVDFVYLWGGDIMMGKVLVRTMLSRPLGIHEGTQYFVPVYSLASASDGVANMPGKIFEVRADRTLVNPEIPTSKGSSAEPFDVLSGLTVDKVRDLIVPSGRR